MGFLSLLATIFCGGAIIADDIHKGQLMTSNRDKARRNNDEIYFTGEKDIFRATSTNEIVYHTYIDHKDMDIGIKTGRVYKCIDHRKEHEDRVAKFYNENNLYLEKTNQGYYNKRWPLWDKTDLKGNTTLGYCKIDKYNGKIIDYIMKMNDGNYSICYADPNCRFKITQTIPKENGKRTFDCRTISSDEFYSKYLAAMKG